MFDYKIIEKNRCQLGEAPIWHRNNKSFYWLDYIDNQKSISRLMQKVARRMIGDLKETMFSRWAERTT